MLLRPSPALAQNDRCVLVCVRSLVLFETTKNPHNSRVPASATSETRNLHLILLTYKAETSAPKRSPSFCSMRARPSLPAAATCGVHLISAGAHVRRTFGVCVCARQPTSASLTTQQLLQCATSHSSNNGKLMHFVCTTHTHTHKSARVNSALERMLCSSEC